ncbi:MAG: hypothetical protein NNA20_00260 [Nitrospira sp.]|nr:hypothetical protein [Nitrospira sp.]MCP9441001.1 hypothetical protein [Nitrospira sp.]
MEVMETERHVQTAEIRIGYRYRQKHPWVITAVNGFLSAYFMEQPGFRVQRHFDELESGMHVWLCDVPATMHVTTLLRRLQADLPPFRFSRIGAELTPHPLSYVIDVPDAG